MRTTKFLAVALASFVLFASACSDDPKQSTGDDTAGTVAHVKVFSFRPNPLKVVAGTKVMWVNDDDIAYTVTSGKRTYEPGDTGKIAAVDKDGLFDLPLDGKGKKGSYTFDKVGTFRYFCDRHPGMDAEVVVTETAPSGSSG